MTPYSQHTDKKYDYQLLFLSDDSFQTDLPLEEIFRERTSEYFSKKKSLDYWILDTIDFNQFFKFLKIFKNKKYHCLLTTNNQFFNFLRLRIGYFKEIKYEETNNTFLFDPESMSEKSDGYYLNCNKDNPFLKNLLLSKKVSFEKVSKKYSIIESFFKKN